MIVLDGSALFAILLDERAARQCSDAIEQADELLISAASVTECLIVAAGKGVHDEMDGFLNALRSTIVPLTADRARTAADSYRIRGKGFHEASLSFGDCFAYTLAMEYGCPLLFVGDDFARTDVAII